MPQNHIVFFPNYHKNEHFFPKQMKHKCSNIYKSKQNEKKLSEISPYFVQFFGKHRSDALTFV